MDASTMIFWYLVVSLFVLIQQNVCIVMSVRSAVFICLLVCIFLCQMGFRNDPEPYILEVALSCPNLN